MSQQTAQGAPPYSEEQITRWLAWLARGMTDHDQTIFLIEKLQPSWLSTRTQRWVYILTSRLIWGILTGLIVGLIDGLIGGSFSDLIWDILNGLIGGLIGGLFVGLIDIIRFAWYHASNTQNELEGRQIVGAVILVMLIGGLIGGLIVGLIVGSFVGLIWGTLNGLIGGLIVGLIVGPIWVFRSLARDSRNDIETVETIRFSWTYFPNDFKNGLIVGLIVGLIFVLIFVLSVGLIQEMFSVMSVGPISESVFEPSSEPSSEPGIGSSIGLDEVLIFVLIFVLSAGPIGGLLSCFQPAIRELKTIPNQGIWLSLRSAGLMGSFGGLALAVIVGLWGHNWTAGLVYGALGGLCLALWYGGLDVIQHFIVRFLLWRAGSLPWRLAQFLDYAADELNFLQKVGGGYIFVHRYLLEHFAAMETDDGGRQTADD